MPDPTTARILAELALQVPCGQTCVDWAVGMLTAGHEGENLGMLAAASPEPDA